MFSARNRWLARPLREQGRDDALGPIVRLSRAPAVVLQGAILCFLAACAAQTSISPPRQPQGVIHVVRSGETLFGIGQRYNISHQELARVNRLKNPDLIRIGQRIFIPGAQRGVAMGVTSAERAAVEAPTRGKEPGPMQAEARAQVESAPELPHVSQIKESDVTQVTHAAAAIQLAEAEDGAFLWPVLGTVHSGFGPRGAGFHDGIDIAAPEGTPIRVVADGEVLYSERLRGYGNIIIVRHDGGYVSVYAHNQVNLVEEGQSVSRGEVIGLVGSTGRATGPHLHFELRKNNRARDPMPYLPPWEERVEGGELRVESGRAFEVRGPSSVER